MPITLRDALPEDEPFLCEVYASTRAQEMALLPWDAEQREAFVKMQFASQHAHYHECYPDAEYKLILQDDQAVGRIYLLRNPEQIRILDITILPQHRNTGIGTPLIQAVLDEGAQSRRPVKIYVETFNPSLRMFERLGFTIVKEEGINFLLEWKPELTPPGHPSAES